MIKSISIVFPFFNEEERLYLCFRDIINFNRSTSKIKKEYIFVSDGSTDTSVKKIKDFINKNKKKGIIYKIISIKNNMGKGNALKQGILNANNK